MDIRPAFFAAFAAAASLHLAGCSSRESRVAAAYADYQSAAAKNDPIATRNALLALVAADEANLDAWLALGRFQLSQAEYGDAYSSFSRAYELDRSNPELLQTLTRIALMSGNFALAKQHADQLGVLDPSDVWVQLTDGFTALEQKSFAKSLATAEDVLKDRPFDPAATVLKARSLVGLGETEDAKVVLERQLDSQPTDLGSARLLAKLYKLDDDWSNTLRVARRVRRSGADRLSQTLPC